ILSGYTDVEPLIEALNLGRVYRYVSKPWNRDEFRDTIRTAIETYHLVREYQSVSDERGRLVSELERLNEQLRRENQLLKRAQPGCNGFEAIIGSSSTLARAVAHARKVAATDSTVLIEGPTGSGKELIARAIHLASARADRLFCPINTATVPESLL